MKATYPTPSAEPFHGFLLEWEGASLVLYMGKLRLREGKHLPLLQSQPRERPPEEGQGENLELESSGDSGEAVEGLGMDG